eukprot:TRINITY_DN6283_c0_g1_i1.p1 TRINITY_DN6283_c0_g1~~TRINITY_DN6283_c0_g1_i1.p1  ORF type:complete len:271 (-),score=111.15 TRINITY_DN6283_c0_g1_i1:65-877(-)
MREEQLDTLVSQVKSTWELERGQADMAGVEFLSAELENERRERRQEQERFKAAEAGHAEMARQMQRLMRELSEVKVDLEKEQGRVVDMATLQREDARMRHEVEGDTAAQHAAALAAQDRAEDRAKAALAELEAVREKEGVVCAECEAEREARLEAEQLHAQLEIRCRDYDALLTEKASFITSLRYMSEELERWETTRGKETIVKTNSDLADAQRALLEAREVNRSHKAELKKMKQERDDLKLSLIHISEPTRLLSISYAVFCLKKKTTAN